MIQIVFKNIERSELAREAAMDRIRTLTEKFPELGKSKLLVTLEMENSPCQPGPDLFKVKLHVRGGKYANLTVTKAGTNLYQALAELVEHLLEKLNRAGDRIRVKSRAQLRDWREKGGVDDVAGCSDSRPEVS